MATVPIRINSKEYHIACDDGQEEHLQALAFDLDERLGQLAYQMGGNPGEVMSLLLAGLMLSDEVIENKKEIDRLSSEVRELTRLVSQKQQTSGNKNLLDMENAMIETLNEVASRIERMM